MSVLTSLQYSLGSHSLVANANFFPVYTIEDDHYIAISEIGIYHCFLSGFICHHGTIGNVDHRLQFSSHFQMRMLLDGHFHGPEIPPSVFLNLIGTTDSLLIGIITGIYYSYGIDLARQSL